MCFARVRGAGPGTRLNKNDHEKLHSPGSLPDRRNSRRSLLSNQFRRLNHKTMNTATIIIKTYRDWTIAKDDDRIGELICYPTESGIQHDYDVDGDRNLYCGNCLWFNDLAEAENGIDDRIIEMQEREIESLRKEIDVKHDKLKIAVQCIDSCKEEFAYRAGLAGTSPMTKLYFTRNAELCDNALKAIQE